MAEQQANGGVVVASGAVAAVNGSTENPEGDEGEMDEEDEDSEEINVEDDDDEDEEMENPTGTNAPLQIQAEPSA